MTAINVDDLAINQELDQENMKAVSGGGGNLQQQIAAIMSWAREQERTGTGFGGGAVSNGLPWAKNTLHRNPTTGMARKKSHMKLRRR